MADRFLKWAPTVLLGLGTAGTIAVALVGFGAMLSRFDQVTTDVGGLKDGQVNIQAEMTKLLTDRWTGTNQRNHWRAFTEGPFAQIREDVNWNDQRITTLETRR